MEALELLDVASVQLREADRLLRGRLLPATLLQAQAGGFDSRAVARAGGVELGHPGRELFELIGQGQRGGRGAVAGDGGRHRRAGRPDGVDGAGSLRGRQRQAVAGFGQARLDLCEHRPVLLRSAAGGVGLRPLSGVGQGSVRKRRARVGPGAASCSQF